MPNERAKAVLSTFDGCPACVSQDHAESAIAAAIEAAVTAERVRCVAVLRAEADRLDAMALDNTPEELLRAMADRIESGGSA